MYEPVLTTQSQLEDAWRELMGPWSYGGHSVWMMLIVDDRPLPQLTEIADAAHPPDTEQLDGLAKLLAMLDREVAPGLRVAFLRSRPGKGTDHRHRPRLGEEPVRRRAPRLRAVRGRAPRHPRRDPSDPRRRRRDQVVAGRSGTTSPMPLSLDEVEDLIDSWEFDPDVDTVGPAGLFVTMVVGDPAGSTCCT